MNQTAPTREIMHSTLKKRFGGDIESFFDGSCIRLILDDVKISCLQLQRFIRNLEGSNESESVFEDVKIAWKLREFAGFWAAANDAHYRGAVLSNEPPFIVEFKRNNELK